MSHFEDTHYEEIRLVQELGEKIGYGNMMSIASALWARKLDDYDPKTGLSTGAEIPTLPHLLTDVGKDLARTLMTNEYGWVALYFKEHSNGEN